MEPTPHLAGLRALKDQGNEHFKKQEWRQAFKEYTRAIDAGRAQLAGGPNLEFRALLATCYNNRAAAGLKLHLYEQVVFDTERALRLLILPGCSEWRWAFATCDRHVYGKAWARRGEAFLELGNMQHAQYCLGRGGENLGDSMMERVSAQMSMLHNYPAPYGRFSLPAAPHPRSSAALEYVCARALRCRIPRHCLFMSAVAWEGRLYCFGGHATDSSGMMFFSKPSDRLFVVDPKAQTVADLDLIRADPESQQRYGLPGSPTPRARHTAVLWGSCMLVYSCTTLQAGTGAPWRSRSPSFVEAERRTVWKLDLAGEPLQWERLYCKDGAAPTLREAHSAVMWQDQMVIYGGEVKGEEVGDVWTFDPMHVRFKCLARSPEPRRPGQEPPFPAPEARKEHAAWVSGDWMYVWGGSSGNLSDPPTPERGGSDFNFWDMWRFSLTEHRWEQVQPRGNPPGPRGEMAYTTTSQGAFVLAGGYTGAVGFKPVSQAEDDPAGHFYLSTYLNDVYVYDPAANWWRVARTSDMQGPLGEVRAGSCAAWAGANLYVVGGYIGYDNPEARREVVEVTLRCCARCGASEKKLYVCERCKAAGRAPTYYCSQECQRADWPVNKVLCSDKGLLS